METSYRLSWGQWALLAIVYGLVALMVIFSLLASQNVGQAGYDRCVQEKCEQRGEAFCNKVKELNNCCQGAGGQLGVINNEYSCVFGS